MYFGIYTFARPEIECTLVLSAKVSTRDLHTLLQTLGWPFRPPFLLVLYEQESCLATNAHREDLLPPLQRGMV